MNRSWQSRTLDNSSILGLSQWSFVFINISGCTCIFEEQESGVRSPESESA